MSTAASAATETLVERFGLKTLVEACLVVEEGVAGVKDIEIGMMMGAGILPGPFARADEQGLDEVLAALERAESEWGESSRRRRCCGGSWPRAASARRAARASSPTRSPTTASSARRCCSRRAATSASCGSTGRRPTRSRRR